MFKLIREWIDRTFSDPQWVILSLLLLTGLLSILWLGKMLLPVFASIVIAYLLDGMISRLQYFKIPRIAAVMVVFIIFLACLLVAIIGLLPMLSRQIGQLLQELPSMIAAGQKELLQLPSRYPEFVSQAQIKQILDLIGAELNEIGRHLLSMSLASVRSLITLLVYLILVPLMVFFMLKDKHKIFTWFNRILPDERSLATEVWREVNLQIGNYVRGKIWEIFIIWGASYFTFKLLGLQFTMLISLFVGLSVLVPYIGVTVMFFPVAMIAYFQWGIGRDFIYVMAAYSIIQLLDGNLLAPLLLSEVVNLHPVAIIVAVLIFGGLWGIWGLFFAIPLATLVHAVMKAWLNRRPTENDAAADSP